jgi:protein phosphatase
MRVLSFSEVGCVRKNNEDAFLTLPEYGVYAVADGMGGHLAGEVAAQTVLDVLKDGAQELKNAAEQEIENCIKAILNRANRQVLESSTRNPANEGMGTTLTALVFRERQVLLAHIGDSRAYLWRGNILTQLTNDHSLVGELVRLGQISIEEADTHPQRHVLVRAVGAAWDIEIDSQIAEWLPGDVFLLCTDGLSNVLSEQDLTEELSKPISWEGHLENMRSMILERGAPDNFTALCCISE